MLRRLFVFAPGEDEPRAVVNPVVVDRAKETGPSRTKGASRCRACASPSSGSTADARGQGREREDVRYELDEFGARVVQHEIDHLDGVLIIDRTDDEHRKEALAALRPRAVLR